MDTVTERRPEGSKTMAIMYTYVPRSSVEGNLGVMGSAKKAVNRGVEHLRESAPKDVDENKDSRAAYLKALDELDVKELIRDLKANEELTFKIELPGVGSYVREISIERFNLE